MMSWPFATALQVFQASNESVPRTFTKMNCSVPANQPLYQSYIDKAAEATAQGNSISAAVAMRLAEYITVMPTTTLNFADFYQFIKDNRKPTDNQKKTLEDSEHQTRINQQVAILTAMSHDDFEIHEKAMAIASLSRSD